MLHGIISRGLKVRKATFWGLFISVLQAQQEGIMPRHTSWPLFFRGPVGCSHPGKTAFSASSRENI
jgi:hypothetical protein